MNDDSPLPPPVPLEADMRGLSFMPLDVGRLLDSDLFALSTGEEFKAAVALWCKCWTQVPASSLPDDDRVLAHLSGAGSRWRKVRAMALRGFVRCADGRLYHLLIAAKVVDAWEMRQRQRARSTRGNNKRWGRNGVSHGDDHDHASGDPTGDDTGDPGSDPTGDRKGQCKGEGNTSGEVEDNSLGSTTVNPLPVGEQPAGRKRERNQYSKDFEEFWQGYPRTPIMSKREAYDVWRRLPDDERLAAVKALPAFKAYCRDNPDYHAIHACRFLSKRRAEGLLDSAERIAAAAGVFVKQGTPQWDAWSTAKGKISPVNKDGGWFFPTEWPPAQSQQAH